MDFSSTCEIQKFVSLEGFEDQALLSGGLNEICGYSKKSVQDLIATGRFPKGTIFLTPTALLRADFVSSCWVCFYDFPFSIGLSYPFPILIDRFFQETGLAFAQASPSLWRILYYLDFLNRTKGLEMGLPELAQVYDLCLCNSSRAFLEPKVGKAPLILDVVQPEGEWEKLFFFVKKSSLVEETPIVWNVTVADLEKIFPASITSDQKIEAFMSLTAEERSFVSWVDDSFVGVSSSDEVSLLKRKRLRSDCKEDSLERLSRSDFVALVQDKDDLLEKRKLKLFLKEVQLARLDKEHFCNLSSGILDFKVAAAKAILSLKPDLNYDMDNLCSGEIHEIYLRYIEKFL